MRDRAELKALGKNDLVREVQRLEALLADQLAQAPAQGEECVVHGIVGMRDGAPLVTYRMGEVAWQQSPAEARMHALVVLDAAVEAERDAATLAFFTDRDLEEQQAGAFLEEMRNHRRDWLSGLRGDGE